MSMADLERVWADRPTDWESRWREVNAGREKAKPHYDAVVGDFLSGKDDVANFRSKMDSLSKREPHWGFRGTSQMFLNQLESSADHDDLAAALRAVLRLP